MFQFPCNQHGNLSIGTKCIGVRQTQFFWSHVSRWAHAHAFQLRGQSLLVCGHLTVIEVRKHQLQMPLKVLDKIAARLAPATGEFWAQRRTSQSDLPFSSSRCAFT